MSVWVKTGASPLGRETVTVKREIYEKVHREEEPVKKSCEVCEILSTKLKQKYNIGKGQFGTTDADWMFFSPVQLKGCWNKSVSNSELM